MPKVKKLSSMREVTILYSPIKIASIGPIYIARCVPAIFLFSPYQSIHNQNPYKSTTYLCYPQSIHKVIHYPQAQSAPK
jgi:hypothetical protein